MKALNYLSLGILTIILSWPAGVFAEGLDEIPEETRKIYDEDILDPDQPIGPSAYRDWKAPEPPPWTIGYASSYAGNTWRAAVMERLQEELIPKWKELGLIDEVIITQSNLKDSVQIQQMRQLVDQGVDALIVCCSNPTALNQTVEYAYERGVPTFSFTGYLTSPYSVNASANYQLGGLQLGRWMAEEINEEGKVLVVEGIPGTSGSDSQHRGIIDGLNEYPDVEIAGTVAGMWTDQVGQQKVQQWLATHPGRLDGIVVQSAAELGVLRALLQSGREMIPITIGGERGAACYWRNNPDYVSEGHHIWPPGDEFEVLWNIMMRTLQGQGPKIQSVLIRPWFYDYEWLAENLEEDCSMNDKGWLHVGPAAWGAEDYLDQFFLRPANPTKYTAADHEG